MLKIRPAVAIVPMLCILATTGWLTSPLFAETKTKPSNTDQQTAKSGERLPLKEAHKSLKSMDTKIPAETSKAVRNTKEAFRKRFNTTQEGGKEGK